MHDQKVRYPNMDGMDIVGLVNKPDGEGPFPCVVLCHHMAGFKEIKHLYALAQALVMKGFVVLRFDFTNCGGESDGDCAHMRLSHQVNDLISTLDYVENELPVDAKRIGVAGHSLGGSTAVWAASQDSRIKALVLLAALAKGKWEHLVTKNFVKEWQEKGYQTFQGPRGEIQIHYGFYEDLQHFDGTQNIKHVHCPVLVLQGDKDEITTLKNSQALFENANQPKELVIMKGVDHMFSKPEWQKEMIDKTVEWFEKYLK